MSSYLRNKDPTSRTRKSVLESPTFSPFSGKKSFKHDRSRGDANEVESALETLGNTSYYTRRELDSLNKTTDFASKDYKKLYEEALAENEKLKACLEDSKQDLAKLHLQLTQKQDKISERSRVSESEKMGKQLLEKRLTEMEEDVKSAERFHIFGKPRKIKILPPSKFLETMEYSEDVNWQSQKNKRRIFRQVAKK